MNPGFAFDVAYGSLPTMHGAKTCEKEVHFRIPLKIILITEITNNKEYA